MICPGPTPRSARVGIGSPPRAVDRRASNPPPPWRSSVLGRQTPCPDGRSSRTGEEACLSVRPGHVVGRAPNLAGDLEPRRGTVWLGESLVFSRVAQPD